MEGSAKLIRGVVLVMVVVATALVVVAESGTDGNAGSFKDCYIKCYIFCIIEPNQTLCSCTTQCFKDCILPGAATTAALSTTDLVDHGTSDDQNHAFCKLGCASSLCSNISKNKNPNGDNVDKCVGSCSKKCTNTYS